MDENGVEEHSISWAHFQVHPGSAWVIVTDTMVQLVHAALQDDTTVPTLLGAKIQSNVQRNALLPALHKENHPWGTKSQGEALMSCLTISRKGGGECPVQLHC